MDDMDAIDFDGDFMLTQAEHEIGGPTRNLRSEFRSARGEIKVGNGSGW